MKKLFLSMTMFAATIGSFAQDAPAPVVNPNAGEMTFETLSIDYGTIKQDADGNRDFVFTNTGKSPVVISSANGSCGCTVPSYVKEPVMPGQKSTIKVHYDTHRVGPFSKTVTVNSDAKTSPITLRISGTVEAAAVAPAAETPASIIPEPVKVTPVVAPVKTTTKAPVKKTVAKKPTTVKKTTTTKKTTTKK